MEIQDKDIKMWLINIYDMQGQIAADIYLISRPQQFCLYTMDLSAKYRLRGSNKSTSIGCSLIQNFK